MEKLDRSSLYESIKALGLQDKVKEIYGKNFTQVSSAELKKLIDEEEKLISVACPDEEESEEKLEVESVEELEKQREEQEEKKEEPKEKTKSIKDESKLIQAVIKLVTKLRQIRVISESDANHILGEL